MESSISRGEQGQEADDQYEVEEVAPAKDVEQLTDDGEGNDSEMPEDASTEGGIPLEADDADEIEMVPNDGAGDSLYPETGEGFEVETAVEASGEDNGPTELDEVFDNEQVSSVSAEDELPTEVEEAFAVEETESASAEQDVRVEAGSSQTIETITIVQGEPGGLPGEKPKKIALVLSGGGARGSFQVGAELYARQVKGYHWDIIAGVSVGAMNGTMLAMHRYRRLLEIWDSISNDQVYSGGFNLLSVFKLLLGAKSFYSNEPLQRMMKRELEAGKVIDDLYVGAVSLVSGEYVQFTKEFLELSNAILASTAIPVVWPPVDVSAEHPGMVDGGVRNISPVGDVLHLEPDEIVIINCGRENPPVLPNAPNDVLSIGLRALDILQNEVFVNDVKEFLRINDLVREAQEQGAVLHHPRTGRALKYYPYVLIEPDEDLGETLDFSRVSVQASLKAGVKRAREVLGRP